jgi:phosphonate transport system ATP-binding protein
MTAPAAPLPSTAATAESALVMRGVSAGYQRRHPVVHAMDLNVPSGSCCALVGPSGCGKTTLLRVMLGSLPAQTGMVERPCLAGLNGGRRCAIGYIPQNLGLVRNLTVRENVLLGALGRTRFWRSIFGRFSASERRRADEALASVGLEGRGSERIEHLSGGERRRVVIARTLLQNPRLLLADEFLAEVDRGAAEEIIDILADVRRRTGMTMVFVDHDLDTACRIADRVVVMSNGSKIAEFDGDDRSAVRVHELLRSRRTG